ncbi:MAG TPA: dTDP-4-keto-6-deoxy-D-glucose epimerase [Bacteroidetes bacterium]|nr:dTDP-4-keto-6-deoxy-D-glucose epimerase [Bacteroidota bacterium]HIL56669.1 dTDP-4-keto-6-deoxy-D-glucose epimerase [Rhodothermales bacterium]
MTLEPTPIPGCVRLVPTWHEDERGGFARTWDGGEFERLGLNAGVLQCSVSRNTHRGTLRGMHYQAAPHEEAKLVRCTRGAIYDVCLDLRPSSRTFRQWTAATLTADNGHALYIPEGCAHGFLTLADDTDVFYMMAGAAYAPEAARGVRYDDPAFGIEWPEPVRVIKDRDATYPLAEAASGRE